MYLVRSESYSSTWTEARARAVMDRVLEDLTAIAMRGLLHLSEVEAWYEDVRYVLDREACELFEVQFTLPSGERRGLRYTVSDDGSLFSDDESGGVDYYGLPAGTMVGMVLKLREGLPSIAAVRQELARRGWGSSGVCLPEAGTRDRTYSSRGYGLVRRRIGEF